jgi:hypothetical protein
VGQLFEDSDVRHQDGQPIAQKPVPMGATKSEISVKIEADHCNGQIYIAMLDDLKEELAIGNGSRLANEYPARLRLSTSDDRMLIEEGARQAPKVF